MWQNCARRAFKQIDTDGSGFIEREELVAYLSKQLSPYEVQPRYLVQYYILVDEPYKQVHWNTFPSDVGSHWV